MDGHCPENIPIPGCICTVFKPSLFSREPAPLYHKLQTHLDRATYLHVHDMTGGWLTFPLSLRRMLMLQEAYAARRGGGRTQNGC